MDSLFEAVINICAQLQIISDFLWNFPTNFSWYANIPIIGNFSLSIIALVGSGIFFSIKFKFVQFRFFNVAIKTLMNSTKKIKGISPLASFLLSSAMRVGPGNILGVTGAISIGGPGALFWMWVSAIFAMATAFVESTLSQIFKDRKNNEYIGGMSFYGRKLLKNSVTVGVVLSLLYIVYAFLCLPAQGFNTISGILSIAGIFNSSASIPNSSFSWITFFIMIVLIALLAFGGLKFITKFTDWSVPIMAVIYAVTVIILVLVNANKIPWFFYVVFTEAFNPNAIFGGAVGVCLLQGIKRGLMSNEAGQGTLSMPAAASNAKHPCEQGNVQSMGVFFDTVVICTPTAFVVIMSQAWLLPNANEWLELGKLEKFTESCSIMCGGDNIWSTIVFIIVCLCFSLFALTTLIGFISFTEICAHRINKSKIFIFFIRICCLFVISFGVICNFAGLDLSALWNLSDMANILMVYFNLPLLYIGLKYVKKSYEHYCKNIDVYCLQENIESLQEKITKLENKQQNKTLNIKENEKYQILKSKLSSAKNKLDKTKKTDYTFTSEIVNLNLKVWDNIAKEENNEWK